MIFSPWSVRGIWNTVVAITFCHLLGLKGSSNVLSIDVFRILCRFSIYMLYFSVYYYAIIVRSHVCLWVLFSSSSDIIIIVITDPLNNYTELQYPLYLFRGTYSFEMLINKLPIWKKWGIQHWEWERLRPRKQRER